MKPTKTPMLSPKDLELERLVVDGRHVTLFVSTTGSGAKCPVCGRYFGRVHSRYTRTVADLPWHGVPMSLHIRVRRFFCENSSCKRAIFAERVPEVAAYARKSDGLQTHSCFDDTRRTIIAICYQMLSRNRIHRLRHAS